MKDRARSKINRIFDQPDYQAFLYDEVAKRLDDRLEGVLVDPRVVMASGFGNHRLKERFNSIENILTFDFAHSRLLRRRKKSGFRLPWQPQQTNICGDLSGLPLASQSVDLVYSNLDLPFFFECGELVKALEEVFRILRPGGLFIFSSFGPDTVKEINLLESSSHFRICDHLDMHDLGDQLMGALFSDPVMEMENLELTYRNPLALLRDVKAHGSMVSARLEKLGLTGKDVLSSLTQQFGRADSCSVSLTAELVFGHAWRAPLKKSPKGRKVVEIKVQSG